MNESIRSRVALLIEQVLSMRVDPKVGLRRGDVDNWDSLNHLRIVLAVEEEFDLHLAPEQVAGLTSLDDVVRLIEGK